MSTSVRIGHEEADAHRMKIPGGLIGCCCDILCWSTSSSFGASFDIRLQFLDLLGRRNGRLEKSP
jgi:hypothetical protein